MQNSNEPIIKNLAIILLCLTTLGFCTASIIHYLSPDPNLMDLIIPPINTVINLILVICLYKNLATVKTTFQIWLISSLMTIGITVWFFLVKVIYNDHLKLSQELPPAGPALFIVYINSAVFAKPNEVLKIGIFSWVFIALPILLYLVYHPSDLFTARGTELFIMFGPAMIFALILVKFNKIIDDQVKTLQYERKQMQILSECDPLTHILNRRGMNERIANLTFDQGLVVGFILFDIDHFKSINDQHGHDIGDIVLSEIAQRCQNIISKDDLIARWGGEEFLILIQSDINNNKIEIFMRIAEDLRKTISAKPIGMINKVTASFGVTQIKSKDSIHISLKCADKAMYMAKQQGRNRVVWLDNT